MRRFVFSSFSPEGLTFRSDNNAVVDKTATCAGANTLRFPSLNTRGMIRTSNSVVEDNIDKRTMDSQTVVVVNKA